LYGGHARRAGAARVQVPCRSPASTSARGNWTKIWFLGSVRGFGILPLARAGCERTSRRSETLLGARGALRPATPSPAPPPAVTGACASRRAAPVLPSAERACSRMSATPRCEHEERTGFDVRLILDDAVVRYPDARQCRPKRAFCTPTAPRPSMAPTIQPTSPRTSCVRRTCRSRWRALRFGSPYRIDNLSLSTAARGSAWRATSAAVWES
jgi:hypothetical protein